MRAAEGGEEVVERVLVGDVDGGEVEVHLVAVFVEDVVLADGGSKRLRGAMRGGFLSSFSGAGCGDADQRRRVLRGGAGLEARVAGCALTPLQVRPAWALLGSQGAEVDGG